MNIFSALFGIFRQKGLVTTIQEGRSLSGFILAATLVSLAGSLLYGFAMGIGLGIDTAVKDAIKVGLIAVLGMLLAMPVFWVAYRLLGRDERFGQVAAVPLTLVATVSIILAITAPVVFLLSVLAGVSPEAVYIHVIIVDLAMLVGLYVAGTLISHGFADRHRLIIPNVIGFLMLGVIFVVLLSFLGPFLAPHPTFSVGTDRLRDGLGIGVAQKVDQALTAAISAERLRYNFQTTNENGDLIRDYTVTRVGDDFSIEIHTHAVPGDVFRSGNRVWILSGEVLTDFDSGRVAQASMEEVAALLGPAFPAEAFSLPPDYGSASWRGVAGSGIFTATGTLPASEQALVQMEAATDRITGLTLGGAGGGPHAERRIREIQLPEEGREDLQASLNQAIVLGSVDRSNASMQEYVQEESFFVVRFPRSWRAGPWLPTERTVNITENCGAGDDCADLAVAVYELKEATGTQQYAEELAGSLRLQPEFREISVRTQIVEEQVAGVVEYLADRTVRGEIETTRHIEYILVGQVSRYHLDFSAPEATFEQYRGLFEEMLMFFAFLS